VGNATVTDTTCAPGAVCAAFQPFGFAGGLVDRETGLARFGARDYDPVMGRWTQKDASGFGGGRNFYAYAWDDPINWVDTTGRRPYVDSYATPGQAGYQAIIDTWNLPGGVSNFYEYGGYIYQNPDGTYSYTPPTSSTPASNRGVNLGDPELTCPAYGVPAGDYHNHPVYSAPGDDPYQGFSSTDFAGINASQRTYPLWSAYLGEPGGALWAYYPTFGSFWFPFPSTSTPW
jgi:RHS repeat-associated protein